MRKVFVNGIKDRDQLKEVFLVKEKITAMAKNGKPYLTIKLMDKSGDVDAKVWDNVDEVAARFEKNDFLEVSAKASVYLGKMQLVISELRKVPEEDVILADFLPETDRDIKEMEGELARLVGTVKNNWLSRLLNSFFTDQDIMGLYRMAPAAKGMHHVYLGGLLEHSLAVASLVDAVVPLYQGLNRDLLIAGALLHDVGKVREMQFFRSFDYSDEGKLIGHITIGVEMIHERACRIADFPPDLAMQLKHLILSHHGQYEYGSPKRPKTIEATILNYLDDLDSKINGIRTHIRKEGEMQGSWTAYHRLYDRYFYVDRSEEPMADEPQQPQIAPLPEKPRERQGFVNNPFEKLKAEQARAENLDLF
ncbi:MAG: HD family phosphohydrolase [Deltaproteobacteria bacterium HGW-Deltaproteobacteria-23]|nr:MAG: HD family phosphohydrolase [Deltaproteobacteria bacterium HGW-Deltaproteobacteria-23]